MLMFNKILVSDAGNYDCVVENSLTTKRSSVYVNVTCKFFSVILSTLFTVLHEARSSFAPSLL